MKAGLYKGKDLIYTWKELVEDQHGISVSNNGTVIESICVGRYSNCDKLIIDDSIEAIFTHAISKNIKELYIGKNIDYIEQNMLVDNRLEYIEVHPENKHFSSENGILYNKNKTILIKYPELKPNKEYIMPNTIKELVYSCFSQSRYLEIVRMSDNIEILPEYCFAYNYALKKIYLPKELKLLKESVFECSTNLNEIIFNDKLEHISNSVFSYTEDLKEITLPKSIKIIDIRAFDFTSIETINYNGLSSDFKKINGYEYIPHKIKINYRQSLEQLIEDGYSFREANKILKQQNEIGVEK